MRILIVEDALTSEEGHWFTYVGGIARGLRALGDTVDILVPQKVTETVRAMPGVLPRLQRSLWLEKSRTVAAKFAFVRSYVADIQRQLASGAAYDYAISLTTRLEHLAGWERLVRSTDPAAPTKFLLLFVLGPGRFTGPGRPSVFPRDLRTVLFRYLLKRTSRHVRRGSMLLATEATAMQDEYQRFCQLPIRLFPHPVENTPQEADCPQVRTGNLRLICPGFARYEKGTDILQEAVRQLHQEQPSFNVQLTLQWLRPFTTPQGEAVAPDPELERAGVITYIRRTVGAAEYDQMLRAAHGLVLPYRASSYYGRVSRVAIEAAASGLPCVYPAGTWLAEHSTRYSAGVSFENESVESLKQAIRKLVRDYESLKALAEAKSHEAREYYSVATFRKMLLSH